MTSLSKQSSNELLSPVHKSTVEQLLNESKISESDFEAVIRKFQNLRIGEDSFNVPIENALHTLKLLIASGETSVLQLSSYLEQLASVSPDRVQKLIQFLEFTQTRRSYVNITDIDLTNNVLLDIEYSLHYIPRSKSNHQPKWEYYLNLVFEGGRIERIVCDISEIEDLLSKLHDACKEIDRVL